MLSRFSLSIWKYPRMRFTANQPLSKTKGAHCSHLRWRKLVRKPLVPVGLMQAEGVTTQLGDPTLGRAHTQSQAPPPPKRQLSHEIPSSAATPIHIKFPHEEGKMVRHIPYVQVVIHCAWFG